MPALPSLNVMPAPATATGRSARSLGRELQAAFASRTARPTAGPAGAGRRRARSSPSPPRRPRRPPDKTSRVRPAVRARIITAAATRGSTADGSCCRRRAPPRPLDRGGGQLRDDRGHQPRADRERAASTKTMNEAETAIPPARRPRGRRRRPPRSPEDRERVDRSGRSARRTAHTHTPAINDDRRSDIAPARRARSSARRRTIMDGSANHGRHQAI